MPEKTSDPELPSEVTAEVTAYAPASVGNVAVGFDLLGHALNSPGDRVTIRRRSRPGVGIGRIHGVACDLPHDPNENTATRAVIALCEAMNISPALEIDIEKGIPLASGLGGSAASAVAAVVAADHLLGTHLSREQLYPFALAGEAVASGAEHGDNVGCQLIGGLVLATAHRLISIPVPPGLAALAVHPDYCINTRDAREPLKKPFSLDTIVQQSANLALVLSGCHQNRLDWIAEGLRDVMIEPRRAALIPGFDQVRQAALDHGALGASISGAGPTVFGWFRNQGEAAAAAVSVVEAFGLVDLPAQAYVSPVDAPAARIDESAR
ncbi:MAG: homoserine kinase [Wenzhouxiangellaceae bacterium]|nr:homoserine kinase [Wenzhouxiangellaceae bacterium]